MKAYLLFKLNQYHEPMTDGVRCLLEHPGDRASMKVKEIEIEGEPEEVALVRKIREGVLPDLAAALDGWQDKTRIHHAQSMTLKVAHARIVSAATALVRAFESKETK